MCRGVTNLPWQPTRAETQVSWSQPENKENFIVLTIKITSKWCCTTKLEISHLLESNLNPWLCSFFCLGVATSAHRASLHLNLGWHNVCTHIILFYSYIINEVKLALHKTADRNVLQIAHFHCISESGSSTSVFFETSMFTSTWVMKLCIFEYLWMQSRMSEWWWGWSWISFCIY